MANEFIIRKGFKSQEDSQITGSISLSGSFKDQENSPGTAGQVLSSTVSGSQWVDVEDPDAVTGSGNVGTIPKWATTTSLSNSIITEASSAITISGNVGIGVTSSAWIGSSGLQVQYATVEGRSTLPSFSEYAANSYSDAGVRKYITNDFASRYTQYQGEHFWYTAPSGAAAGDTITFSPVLSIASTGAATFYGALSGTSATFSSGITSVGGSNQEIIASATGDFFPRLKLIRTAGTTKTDRNWSFDLGSDGTLFLEDNTASATRLSIDTLGAATFSGTSVIGVTVANTNYPINGAYNSFGNLNIYTTNEEAQNMGGSLTLGGTGAGGVYSYGAIYGKKESTGAGSALGYLAFATDDNNNLVERMRITSGGNVGIGTNSPGFYELTFKNIVTISSAAASTDYAIIELAGGSAAGGGIQFGNQTVRQAGIFSLNGSDLGLYTNSTNSGSGLTEGMRITSGGVLQANYGISFPNAAAAGGTIAATPLNAYEEGTWTATMAPSSGGTITLNLTEGRYTRVGRQVTLVGFFQVASITGAPTGIISISGLPYNNGSATSNYTAVSIYANTLASGATTFIQGIVVPSTNYINLYRYINGASSDVAPYIQGSTHFIINCTYFIS